MARSVTRKVTNVLFGPVIDWGQSIVVRAGRQYTLEECSKWVNEGRFEDCLRASQRAADLPFGETDRLEFESREFHQGIISLEDETSWEVVGEGSMIIQEAPSRYQDFQVEVEEAMEENGECSKSISYTPKGGFTVKKTFRTPQKRTREVKNRYEGLMGVNADFPMPEPMQSSPTPAPRAKQARFAQDIMQEKLQFQSALPILTETSQIVQHTLPDTQLEPEMHLDDCEDNFTDSDAEMDRENAQNPPTSAPGCLASSRYAPATQETQEEDIQAEIEEQEPRWDRTWDVLDFFTIIEQGIKTLHESNANKKQKAKMVAVIAA